MGETSTCASLSIWEEIDISESYLVCSMYEEAASIASSVLKRLCDDDNIHNQESYDMMESAGMVLVQSLKELGRAADILDELKPLFVSVTDIPVQVLLTGACIKISEGSYLGVREFLEEFLSKWRYLDERYYVLDAEKNVDFSEGCDSHFVMEIDQYLEAVEVYAVTLLGTVLDDVDLAISWIEKAGLPEGKRQVLLRRLHSLHSLKATIRSQGSKLLPADLHQAHSSSDEPKISERSSEALYTNNYLPNGENVTNQAILKFSRETSPRSWWLWPITLKFGNAQTVLSNGKLLLGCLIFLAYFVSRRKKANIKRIVRDRLLSMKKVLVDLWQLAFSFQVNPLAAVQSLPDATRGGR